MSLGEVVFRILLESKGRNENSTKHLARKKSSQDKGGLRFFVSIQKHQMDSPPTFRIIRYRRRWPLKNIENS